MSYHLPILVTFKQPDYNSSHKDSNIKPFKELLLNETTNVKLAEDLQRTNWPNLVAQSNCPISFNLFCNKYLDVIKSTLAVRLENNHIQPIRPWFNSEHHQIIADRNSLHHIYEHNPTPANWELCRQPCKRWSRLSGKLNTVTWNCILIYVCHQKHNGMELTN